MMAVSLGGDEGGVGGEGEDNRRGAIWRWLWW